MSRTERRVVITGIGLVTPLGLEVEQNFDALVSGQSGIGPITQFDASDFPVRFAGEVRDFDPGAYVAKKEIKKIDRFTQFAIAAAGKAVTDAGFVIDESNADRVGCIVGVGMGGIRTIEDSIRAYTESGLKRVSPFFIPRLIANLAPGQISIQLGCKGVNYTTTSACASGGHAIGEAFRLVRFGDQDAMLTGGSEAAISTMGVGGFAAMRALSTRNDAPQRASRPFDRDRDGFVMAEGAGMLVLEPLEEVQARGANIYAEIVGYGANADAYHITSPAPDGIGAARCMKLALGDGGIDPATVDYVNAHGTSTQYNDANETLAIKRVFGDRAARMPVSSTKSMTGHMLGAAGAVETAYVALTIQRGIIPPTINYETPDPDCRLDCVPNEARQARVRIALTNAFGFGGTNACLALRSIDAAAPTA